MHLDIAQFYSALRNVVVRLLPHAMVAAKPCRTTQGFLCVLYVVIFVISLVLSHFKLLKLRILVSSSGLIES